MANKSLTDLVARTATADSDLIHVNSGGTDYKETKANFLKGNLYHSFSNNSPITTQIENLSNGTYFGSIDSYGHQSETGVPANNSYYVYAEKTGGSNIFIRLVGVNQAGVAYYKIKSTQGWASDWTKEPTRTEVDELSNSFVRDIDSIAAGSSKTYTLGNSSVIMLVLMGTAQSRMAIYNIYVTSAGAVYVYPMVDGSNITITNSTNSITIANTVSGSGLYVHVSAIVFKGSISG